MPNALPPTLPAAPSLQYWVAIRLTENDGVATARVAEAFGMQFVPRAYETQPASASEDFSVFGRNWMVPYVFWFVGGTDPAQFREATAANQLNALPSNHSPRYARVIHPTLKTGL